jgi:hypothetical protein
VSAVINRRAPGRYSATEADAATESARYERMQQAEDLAAVFRLALATAERYGDADAVRRIRGARSLLSERLGLRGD